ncbi:MULTISPECIES: flagellin [Actibacterium]|uniref:Flagellar hook-associated protein 3 FlgL n=1 Tax=Actibacterium naphthalenivorans TaxID=1614693 RepID=A0A840C7U4_9RHOB|nr:MULTISPECIES: flagellin [Actibacterium]ALG88962.1 hypothetical protein TQ29_00800 [Actibacterium sp. EMB200-NS6]MBB4021495.1 flagellar hook-associated protein 3 FlgL [Actibacterium naphthalenivorans]
MTSLSIGDMAQSLVLRRQNSNLKTRMGTLSQELVTGLARDPGKRLSGDFTPLAAIERSLTVLGAYKTALTEAKVTTDAMQASLGTLDDMSSGLYPGLFLAGSSVDPTLVTTAGVDAMGKLEHAVSVLNTQAAGRSLFSGAATDTPALVSADDIMSGLRTAVSGAVTADDVMAAAAAWFGTQTGGFETQAYQGSATPAGPVRLADGHLLSLDITAADPALRGVIRGVATAALLEDPELLGGDATARAELAQQAAEHLLTAERPLATLRAELGNTQNRIETISAENASQTSAMEIARTELIGADPYDTATEMEAVQGQLETLYTVTARLSRLSLADFLT